MWSVDQAHARLVARDPALPALGLLLEPSRLGERLGLPLTRSYLRYKPGTSAVALLDVAGRPAIAQHWGRTTGEKRAKALRAPSDEQVLRDDPDQHLLVVDAMADRKLPALRTHVLGGRLQRRLPEPVALDAPVTLAHKPGRRWVGRAATASGSAVTLRVYPEQDLADRAAAHDLVLEQLTGGSQLRLPRLLARHDRGVLALEHLPGQALTIDVDDSCLHRLGEQLGAFHAAGTSAEAGVGPLPGPSGPPAISGTLPEVFGEAAAVARAARAALRPVGGTIVHGDFSLDQVVATEDGLGLIDLDRARAGGPVEDVAGLLAHAALDVVLTGGGPERALATVGRIRGPLLAGHRRTWPGPGPQGLAPRVALSLLARSGEPFGGAHPEWVRVTRDLVETAGRLVAAEELSA